MLASCCLHCFHALAIFCFASASVTFRPVIDAMILSYFALPLQVLRFRHVIHVLPLICQHLVRQVYAWLAESATRLPKWDSAKHVLCMRTCVVPEHQQPAASGAIHAVVTTCTRDLMEAVTLREAARNIVAPVPTDLDARGRRIASTRWMQPRPPPPDLIEEVIGIA